MVRRKNILIMKNRYEKLQLLDQIFNQSNKGSLQFLSRPIFPNVLMYQEQNKGLLFSGRLNPSIPKRYLDVILNDNDVYIMLAAGGNATTFLLPDYGRD